MNRSLSITATCTWRELSMRTCAKPFKRNTSRLEEIPKTSSINTPKAIRPELKFSQFRPRTRS